MNAKVRSRIERGRRALEYSRAHADQSAGYTTALTRLEERLARCDALANQQLEGFHEVRATSARKSEIRRVLSAGHLRHLVKVGRLAAAELPELAERMVLPPRTSSYMDFRTTARAVLATAVAQKELLVRYGLVEQMLDETVALLARFDEAMEAGVAARRAHVSASEELDRVVGDLRGVVLSLDGLNRARFAGDPELLREWKSAMNIVDVRRGVREGEGEVETAA